MEKPRPSHVPINRASGVLPNSEFHLDLKNAEVNRKTIKEIVGLMSDTIDASQINFAKHFDPHAKKPGLVNLLTKIGCGLPQFSLYDTQLSESFLNKSGFGDIDIDKNNFLLVYRLPKIIEQSCGRFFEQEGFEENPKVARWVGLQKPATRALWQTIKQYEDTTLSIERLNERKDHRAGLYHYLYQVGLKTN